MSHVTDVKMRVRDIGALREAAEACGLELREGQTTYAWWGQFVGDSNAYGQHDPKDFGKCEHALRVKGTNPRNGSSGPWEIGVVKAKDGDGFDLLYDRYGNAGRALEQHVGDSAKRLKREYSAAMATRRAKATVVRRGFTLQREDLLGGRIRLRLRKR